jgi:hypothetical protein
VHVLSFENPHPLFFIRRLLDLPSLCIPHDLGSEPTSVLQLRWYPWVSNTDLISNSLQGLTESRSGSLALRPPTMAVVLPAEESDYFRPASSMRRSHSQTHFASPSTSYHSSSAKSSTIPSSTHSESYQPSESSSASSSPRTVHAESVDLSYASTPATAFSVLSDYEEALSIDDAPEDHFSFPSYGQDKFFLRPEYHRGDSLEPPPSPQTNDNDASCVIEDDSAEATGPGTPDCSEHAEDDTAVVSHPSRQVDYLSHDWREEDIWSSWRYIVSRRGEFANSARL